MNIFPGKEFSLNDFKTPSNEYDVTYMWFWNLPISRELIDSELAEYKKAGVRSIYIVPLPINFRPETIRTFLHPEYLSEEYFDIIDDNVIKDAIDTGDGLKIGDAHYRHIVVPKCKYTPEDVKKKIEKYLGEGAPTYTFKSKNLRVLTRKLYKSRLWFLFNEGEDTVCEALDISDGKKVYEIDPQSGRITRSSADKALLTGDIAVYLVTDEELATDSDEAAAEITLSDFTATRYDRFVIEYEGIKSLRFDGEPTLDENFSGTVFYEAGYKLPEEPKAGDTYRITLSDTATSARVSVDGQYACDLGITPMVGYIPAELFKSEGKIELAVSNTAANEILAKMDVILSHPKAEVGCYNPKMIEFESRRPKLAFGTAKIEKV